MGVEAPDDIVVRVVAGGDFLGLEQDPGALSHVVVEPLPGRGGGLVDKPQGRGVVLKAAVDPQCESLLIEGDGVLLQRSALGDHDAVHGVTDLAAHQMPGEGAHPLDQPARLVRHELGPTRL